VLRAYLLVVGGALLVQGASSLVLHELLSVNLKPLHGFLTTDDRHAALHVVWGVILLAVTVRPPREQRLVGLVFGVFYVALGVLGLLVHDPFGLQLGWGENVFHLVIGPLALGFVLLA
jgi:Domain of unknown function (DUF4383)